MGVEGAAGVVLAGGRSSRMGSAKAALEWHGSTLLYRTAAVLARSVDGPVVVVRAPGQRLPPLPPGVTTTEDPVSGLGPMQGIAAGLAAVADHAELAFVCSTDLPFLHPAYVTRVLDLLRDPGVDLVMPVTGGYRQPLAAGYRTGLAPLISGLLAEGDLRPGMLPRHFAAALPDAAALLADPDLDRLDPDLASVRNVNTPEEYAAARRRPGPSVRVDLKTAQKTELPEARQVVEAATLAEAAAALGLRLDRVAVVLNGRRVPADGWLPLVNGDNVRFEPAEASASHPGTPGVPPSA
jgi:molybdopterin-guanine dinucleotide biosynthesis protein A